MLKFGIAFTIIQLLLRPVSCLLLHRIAQARGAAYSSFSQGVDNMFGEEGILSKGGQFEISNKTVSV